MHMVSLWPRASSKPILDWDLDEHCACSPLHRLCTAPLCVPAHSGVLHSTRCAPPLTLAWTAGRITLESVEFAYPARLDVPVLTGFSLDILPGQSVALVGASGSGKSTVIQLLQRFYDPTQGRILVDGLDLRTVNLAWYRAQVRVWLYMYSVCTHASNVAS